MGALACAAAEPPCERELGSLQVEGEGGDYVTARRGTEGEEGEKRGRAAAGGLCCVLFLRLHRSRGASFFLSVSREKETNALQQACHGE